MGMMAILAVAAAAGLSIGDRLQVLCDPMTVDASATTAERRQHRPEFAGTVLIHDEPWEGDMCGYHNILRDSDEKGVLYRMYYNACACGYADSKFRWTGLKVCYAESRDGINWTKPKLGICAFKGSKSNNIILSEKENYWDNFMVMKDENPDCPAAERYKGIGLWYTPNPGDTKREEERGLVYYSSADGIHFKRERLMMRRWMPPHRLSFDSLNVLIWDAEHKEYRMYLRGSVKLDKKPRYCHFETKPGAKEWVRTVRLMTSKDFKVWSDPVEIGISCKDSRFDMYTNGIEPYFRNPQLYLGFPTRYSERMEWTDTYDRLCTSERRSARAFEKPIGGEHLRVGLAITDSVFMWSTNGRDFTVGEDAFLTPGPEFDRNWVYGSCYLARGMVETPGRRGDDRELSFYPYVGRFSGTATELDRYVLRTDGFVSYHSGVEPKRLVTRPVVFDGGEMLVNFATSAFGYLKIVVTAEDGAKAESFELFGDRVDRLVGFKSGDLAALSGKKVVISFEISDGDVYSYRFRKIKPVVIAEGGRSHSAIAVDAGAPTEVLKAADELKSQLEKKTGAAFSVVTNSSAFAAASTTIEVGTRRAKDLVGRLRIENAVAGSGSMVVKDGSVALVGKDAEGLAKAVKLFLDRVPSGSARIELTAKDGELHPSFLTTPITLPK